MEPTLDTLSTSPETPLQTPEAPVSETPAVRFGGFATLGLIFVASAIFTASYLSATDSAGASPSLAASAVATDQAQPAAAATSTAFNSISLMAKSAIVVDTTTGRTLYEKDADIQWPLASLTKVPMALAVSEVLKPDDVITIPYDTKPAGTDARLTKGSRWHVQDVLDFTLVISSNEGADILAAAADSALHERYPQAPTGEATVWRMNSLARELHLPHTYFLNVNGLDESPTQSGAYGTARDIEHLFAYAAAHTPATFAATQREGVTLTSLDGKVARAYNTDEALDAVPRIVMGKTGYTTLAGGNLAIVFDTAAGHRVIAVVLGSTQQGRFTDMKTLVVAAEDATSQQQLGSIREGGATIGR